MTVTPKLLFTFAFLFLSTLVFGQKTEFGIAANSGLFSFTGPSAESVTAINYSDDTKTGGTNNPYGSEPGLSYGVSANVRRVSRSRLIAGVDIGFEVLRSKININTVNGIRGATPYSRPANGKSNLALQFINLQPFIGYRLPLPSVLIDLSAGLDLGRSLKVEEKGSATTNDGTRYQTKSDRNTIKTDIRPRLQIEGRYNRLGVYAGYSAGLSDYLSGYIGGSDNSCYSRIVRFGLTYKIK